MPVIVTYNELNRLIHAMGKTKSATYEMAMTFGRMSEPLTKVQRVDSSLTAKSYNFAYKYEDENHPTAPTQIGHDHYEANLKRLKSMQVQWVEKSIPEDSSIVLERMLGQRLEV